ncbi:MAG TPA: hypothetical protein VF134_08205 [Candidatus Dormibacteraeota bacterium]
MPDTQQPPDDLGDGIDDLEHPRSVRRATRIADEVEGFQIHNPTPDELAADDGYVHEPPDVAAADIAPTQELED